MKKIESAGEKVTIARVRQEVGGGSPDTIMGILREIEEETLATKYPAEAQAIFRGLYCNIFEKGRADRQSEIDGLSRDLDVARIERDAARLKQCEIEARMKDTLAHQAMLQDKLRNAMEESIAGANKIVALQEEHSREIREVRRKLDLAQKQKNQVKRRPMNEP